MEALEAGRFEEALKKAASELSRNPWDVESLVIKAKALMAIEEYGVAIVTLESALEMVGDQDGIEELLRKSKLLEEQSNGVYNILLPYYMSDKFRVGTEQDIRVSNFLGPIEIRISEGRGRGLFAAKDLKAGELLFVCNPLAYIPEVLLRALAVEEVVKELIRQVEIKSVGSTKIRKQLHYIQGGRFDQEVPAMDLFCPNRASVFQYLDDDCQEQLKDIDNIIRMVVNDQDSQLMKCRGLWTLLTFINHSCIPTVTLNLVGNVLFCRAARSIPAGQELLCSYKDSTIAKGRTSVLGLWEIDCKCRKCVLEVQVPLTHRAREARPRDEDLACLLEDYLSHGSHNLNEEDKQCIRSAYARHYLGKTPGEYVDCHVAVPPAEKMMEAVHQYANGCMFRSCLQLQCRLLRCARDKDAARKCLMDSCVSNFGPDLAPFLNNRVEYGLGAF